MIIPPENYSKCLKCPHCCDDDEGLYCELSECIKGGLWKSVSVEDNPATRTP
jgi:hypothetical protein